mmetsp:Transcript_165705/g.532024  ORF Transcript_165705/g.532024 Transcript_165705/m.532024 type:complete len:275 (-) Transcript_165705:412-1236(-)
MRNFCPVCRSMPSPATMIMEKGSWRMCRCSSPTASRRTHNGSSRRFGTRSTATSRLTACRDPWTWWCWTRSSCVATERPTRTTSSRSFVSSTASACKGQAARASAGARQQLKCSGRGSKESSWRARPTTCGSPGTTRSGPPATMAPSLASSRGFGLCSKPTVPITSADTTTCWNTSRTVMSIPSSWAPAKSAATRPSIWAPRRKEPSATCWPATSAPCPCPRYHSLCRAVSPAWSSAQRVLQSSYMRTTALSSMPRHVLHAASRVRTACGLERL